MEQYNLTSSHHFGDKHKYLQHILSFVEDTEPKALKKFIKQFYFHVPMLNLSKEDCQVMYKLAARAFTNARTISTNDIKINFYDSEEFDSSKRFTVIEVIGRDREFLVDSIRNTLKRNNLEIIKIIHPVIKVIRDKSYNLLDIAEFDPNPSELDESIIHIYIRRLNEQTLKNKLDTELRKVVDHVKIAVGDWKNMLEALQNCSNNLARLPQNERLLEKIEFLKQLKEQYFVFLGSASYEFEKHGKNFIPSLDKNSKLGILKLDNGELQTLIDNTVFNHIFFYKKSKVFIDIGKLNKSCIIHRDANIDYVCVKEFDSEGQLSKAVVFLGLFTYILYYKSVNLIPLIRPKVKNVLKKANLPSTGHAAKKLIGLMEDLPRDELFQITEDQLYKLIMEVYALVSSPALKLFVRKDDSDRFINCIIFLPDNRVNSHASKEVQQILSKHFGQIVTFNYQSFTNSSLFYYHVIMDNNDGSGDKKINLHAIEKELDFATSIWTDRLNVTLQHSKMDTSLVHKLYDDYEHAFPNAYQGRMTVEHSIKTMLICEELNDYNKILFKVVLADHSSCEHMDLEVYSLNKVVLTYIMPILHDMGFNVIDEFVCPISPKNKAELWFHSFKLELSSCYLGDANKFKHNIEDTLQAIFYNNTQNDIHNRLIVAAGLVYREVTLLRALGKFLCQTGVNYSKQYLGQTLTNYPVISALLVELFYAKFDPKIKAQKARQSAVNGIISKIKANLENVHDSVADRILKRYLELIENILRTNFFQKDQNGKYKEYISIKIDSNKLLSLPLPRPFREIFVYSAKFEAIHLRGGRVARGGIRWSDRSEDFRTEILGLMKTQVAKNAVIVPGGAKGGFVVKTETEMDRDSYFNYGVECYKNFLRGVLDITDNIIEGNVIHPHDVVIYDDEDPYLVAAADKGTATFSDYANAIAHDYNFWLGDAFASGGSAGYDHKKMAITARGAWISVIDHFHELGVDIDSTDFTVIGIGDMSGDVFGNGMLLSKHIKLIAAFNHVHIFIDPNPDSAKSFAERQRLFNLPRSSWTDYNSKILSKGAKIFDRKAKTIELNQEIKDLLDIDANVITPDELIRYILLAKADLLWNGGIGTYVKSKDEYNEQVGDKTNDAVRVNGSELRCKIVGEGGNLGFTQLGRIEYALNGGKINTDAIDNSGGVDCSDHEVNIKIVLNAAQDSQKMTLLERNKLLERMTENVAELVLKDNYLQNLAITLAEDQNYLSLESYERFINFLKENNVIDPKLEKLPAKQEINRRLQMRKGLTRPELSVLLAYSKISIAQDLLNSNITDDPYFNKELFNYFPKLMQDRFKEQIEHHPLRKEIIVSVITNNVVNRVAPYFVQRTSVDLGRSFSDIIRAYTITHDVFGIPEIWAELKKIENKLPLATVIEIYNALRRFMGRLTLWLLRNYTFKIDINEAIAFFKPGVAKLECTLEKYIKGKARGDLYNVKFNYYKDKNLPPSLAKKIALLNPMLSSYNIIYVANKAKLTIDEVADIYFSLGEIFNFEWLRLCADQINMENSWQRLAIKSYKDDLYDTHRKLTADVINSSKNLIKWQKENEENIIRYESFIMDLKQQDTIDFSMLTLALHRMNEILKD